MSAITTISGTPNNQRIIGMTVLPRRLVCLNNVQTLNLFLGATVPVE
jgi:hypothetical protein